MLGLNPLIPVLSFKGILTIISGQSKGVCKYLKINGLHRGKNLGMWCGFKVTRVKKEIKAR